MRAPHGRPQRRAARWVLAAAAAAAPLVPAAPAWAHSQLLHTDPADGAVLRQPLTRVVLTFNEMVEQRFTIVVVTGPDGRRYSEGPVRVVDDNVTEQTYPTRSGRYTVAWRAVSADGHPVQGRFRFTVALPPGTEPSAPPPGPAAARSPATTGGRTGLVTAGGVLVLGGLAWTLRRRARTGTR